LLKDMTGGAWPLGWYTGRDSPNTRRLVVDHGRLRIRQRLLRRRPALLDAGDQDDGSTVQHLVLPYSLDTNDMRFVQAQGFNTGDHFFTYLRDSFDALYAEGDPRMRTGPR